MKCIKSYTTLILLILIFIISMGGLPSYAENYKVIGNIDPDNDGSQYAWGENVGWINFEPSLGLGGVTVTDSAMTGYVWGENIGWINLSPTNGGVINDGAGNLSGYAWGENVGWINFAPTGGGVTINPNTGDFSGRAWGENIGWVTFSSAGLVPYKVKTGWRVASPNQPPVANAGPDQTIEATSPSGASVTLNGSLSSDPDGGALSFTWTWSSGGVSGANPTVTLPLGVHTITLEVSDGQATAADNVLITVQDTTPPAITCPANQTVEATSTAGAVVNYSPATATDAVSTPTIVYSQDSGTVFPMGTTAVTATATDSAGNRAYCSFDVTVQDTTPPAIACPANQTVEATSSAGATVNYLPATATDAVSTPVIAYSQASGTVFPMGTTAVTATATDAAGNSASCQFNVAVQDTTPPIITSSQNPLPNTNGWSNTDVTVTFSATDVVSTAIQCEIVALQLSSANPISVTLNNEGASQTVNVVCMDGDGNSATASHTVNIDKTAPIVTVTRMPDANANGWNNTDVTAHFTATDGLSGIQGDSFFDVFFTVEGAGQGATQTFTDRAGNTASAIISNINIDKTPPLLTLPSFAASYTLGSGLTISFSATDSLSLIDTMEAEFNGTPVTDGASVTLTQIGVNTFSMSAADRAGNNVSETRTFTVNYSFGGFLSPLVPDGTYNLGRVIPVKFALSDANGNPVSSAVARLSLQQISGGEPVGEPIEASSVSSADSGNIFRYNGDHYIYNLDTRPLSAGIWQMQVMLDDGSVHTIQIGLKSK